MPALILSGQGWNSPVLTSICLLGLRRKAHCAGPDGKAYSRREATPLLFYLAPAGLQAAKGFECYFVMTQRNATRRRRVSSDVGEAGIDSGHGLYYQSLSSAEVRSPELFWNHVPV